MIFLVVCILNTSSNTLSPLIAGPILRHCATSQFTVWLVTRERYQVNLTIKDGPQSLFEQVLNETQVSQVQVGKYAFINLITVEFTTPLPENTLLHYDIALYDTGSGGQTGEPVFSLAADLNDITYDSEVLPSFAIKTKISQLYHGSCRKPHFDSGDGLCQLDNALAKQSDSVDARPSMLLMSGDQVYVDDVAGPMLSAIHQVIDLLGLFDEQWQRSDQEQPNPNQVLDSQALFANQYGYYQREKLLPHHSVNPRLVDKFLGASKQPIFTSVNAKNHLVTLSEVIAMYFLVWSPNLWSMVDTSLGEEKVSASMLRKYRKEQQVIEHFANGLNQVRRALAHVPVYMIFDDHDVTDDWNLTRGWEDAAYNHPFSKRIIGNALVAYYLCQGWGNAPQNFGTLAGHDDSYFTESGVKQHDELIDKMLAWDHWHYHLKTSPKLLVLDTRTQRWRSESNAGKPSGLMDWESLTELQQELINEPCVIMVSAAPIYGVKLIEAVQRVFTFFGKPLAVDAENWMAHSGTANVMLNIFRHHKTPPQFIILSGDVHYSFVYDISHRFIRNSSRIVQITCSGIKNKFPEKLLHTLERLNRILYGTNSPLNWFTKRRRMKIKVRKPSVATDRGLPDNSLFNGSGIGVLTLSEDFEQVDAQIITDSGDIVQFKQSEETT